MKTLCIVALCIASSVVMAQANDGRSPAQVALTQKWVGSYDTEALFRDPQVAPELKRVVGGNLGKLMKNLSVRADVAFVGGSLAVAGNADHGGGEEEAIVCVDTYKIAVHAAILSARRITVYTRQSQYDAVPLCIKDWITEVSSGHRNRFTKPANVQVVTSK